MTDPPRPYLRNVAAPAADRAPAGAERAQRPKGLAHRGFAPGGLENSLAAVTAAVDLGYGWVELDVQASADGELFVFHDDTLDRVTDTTGRISMMTAEAVRRVRVGGTDPIPTLAELLTRFPVLRLNIDVKTAAGVAPLAAAIERLGAHDRVLVASFSDRRRRAVLRRLTRPTATSAGTALTAIWVLAARIPALVPLARRLLRAVDCYQVPATQRLLGIDMPVLTPAGIALAHRWGQEVHVWTINDPAVMRRLLDAGVDGIVSDRADLLAGVLAERGAWPQA